MRKILVTGFTKFGDYPANSTQRVLEMMEEEGALGQNISVHAETLAATIPKFDRGDMILSEALRLSVSGVVALGMSSEKKGLCVETRAYNHTAGRYCPEWLDGRTIDPEEDPCHFYQLDIERWRFSRFHDMAKRARIKVTTSMDAGRFCCNHLMYQMRRAQLQNVRFMSIPWIFVHLPCSPASIPAPEQEFHDRGKVVMEPEQAFLGLKILLGYADIWRI